MGITTIVLATVTALLATTAPALAELPTPIDAATARVYLNDLKLEAPHSMNGYSRAKFPHWTQQRGNCDTQEVILARDGTDVKTDDRCRVISGIWHSPYDDKTITSASQIVIDMVVPLANAWRSGADMWTIPERKQFANDLTHPQLVAVSAGANRSKGDQDPSTWKPPVKSYWCMYSRAWVQVKHVYQLTITDPEKAALTEMLNTC
ncbi:hypothetical protein BGZ81_010992 [Podila clonocystis]|nr:hypothetical protein BGZ81_010992 [Podila clonocystis]